MPPLPRPLLAAHPVLETDDLDAVRAVTGRAWGKHTSDIVGGDRYRLRLNRAQGKRLAVTFVDCSARIDARMEGTTCLFQVIVPFAGGIDIEIGGRRLSASPGRALLVRPAQRMRFVASPTRCLLVDLPVDTEDGGLPRHVASIPSSSGTTLAGRAGNAVVSGAIGLARLHDRFPQRRDDDGPPPAVDLAEATLLARMSDLFGGSWTPHHASPPEQRVVEDLLEWLRDHCGAPVTMADLARHAGVSMRAVEQAFARHVGAAPSECLRSMRLDRARTMLERAPADRSVTGVALDAGFRHFGRFSAEYRRRFGELPSETLSRGKAATH